MDKIILKWVEKGKKYQRLVSREKMLAVFEGIALGFSDDNEISKKLVELLPYIDEIKVNRDIVEASTSSNKIRDMLGNIIELGNKLKIRVVCEGIETKEQENLLIKLGCKYGQGFLNSESTPLK